MHQSDIFSFTPQRATILVHIVNDSGMWGKGFVLAINKKYPSVVYQYKDWYRKEDFKLGRVQFCKVSDNLTIANMVAQSQPGGHVFNFIDEIVRLPPIRLDSLKECLYRVREFAERNDADIIGPKFGSGLAGGDWNKEIVPIINQCLKDITIYELL